MVKLAHTRQTCLYGPRESRETFEYINAIAYAIATILLLAGVVLVTPGLDHFAAWILLIIAFSIIILVNLHDLYAQLAGFDFKLPLLTYDPQLALIEVAAPLVYAIGGILFLAGVSLFLQIDRKSYLPETRIVKQHEVIRLFIAGSAFWLLGSIHNAFQVFERSGLRVQALQKAVSIPFLIGSTLFLISSILGYETSHIPVDRKLKDFASGLAIVGAILLVVGAIVNAIRIKELHEIDHHGGSMEKLRGGAQERLDHERGERRGPLLETPYPGDPESHGYKEALTR